MIDEGSACRASAPPSRQASTIRPRRRGRVIASGWTSARAIAETGRTAVPRPRAASWASTGGSPASKAIRGSKPAAAHASSNTERTPVPGGSVISGRSAARRAPRRHVRPAGRPGRRRRRAARRARPGCRGPAGAVVPMPASATSTSPARTASRSSRVAPSRSAISTPGCIVVEACEKPGEVDDPGPDRGHDADRDLAADQAGEFLDGVAARPAWRPARRARAGAPPRRRRSDGPCARSGRATPFRAHARAGGPAR